MAECEVCKEIVEPGDMVVIEEKSQPHFFCSTFHRDMWKRGETMPVLETVTIPEPEPEPEVKAKVVATGHKVTAEEMAARKEAAAKDAEQPAKSGPPSRGRGRSKKSS